MKGIRRGRKGKVFNRKRSNWAYAQFRNFVLYAGNREGPLSSREITRFETGVSSPKNISGFVEGLSFLVYHDLILRDVIYEFTDTGILQPIDPNK